MRFLKWLFRDRPKTLYIVRGLPGSGKSTLAESLTPWNVAADDYPGLYEGGYQMQKQGDSHRWCFEQVRKMMRQGKRAIAVHNTFIEVPRIQPYLDLAAKNGYRVSVVHCENAFGSIHNVPDEVIESMKTRWENINEI
jgi:predicted kinase